MPHPLRLRRAALLALALLLALLFGLAAGAGCGSRDPGNGPAAETDPEWLGLQRSKADLDHRRERLALAQRGASAKAPETQSLARDVATRTVDLDRRLVDFINAHPPVQGEPLTHRQQAALRMKSDEDLALAREHVAKGGDYERAAEICEAALAVDPDNDLLKEELAKIRAARFMTSERFFTARKGMTPAEVREALGAPNPHNVRAYPERGIEAWFYPKDESGAAAGVWFEKRSREEDTKVYQLDFDAVGGTPGGVPGAPPPPAAPKAPAVPKTAAPVGTAGG
jgi:hypothetical protein